QRKGDRTAPTECSVVDGELSLRMGRIAGEPIASRRECDRAALSRRAPHGRNVSPAVSIRAALDIPGWWKGVGVDPLKLPEPSAQVRARGRNVGENNSKKVVRCPRGEAGDLPLQSGRRPSARDRLDEPTLVIPSRGGVMLHLSEPGSTLEASFDSRPAR